MTAAPKHKMTMENLVAFASVDCELTLGEIYRRVKFPPASSVIRPV